MKYSARQGMKFIEEQYHEWIYSFEEIRETTCQIEGVDLTMTFHLSRWIYHSPCSPPKIRENSINISSTNNDKIQQIFEKYLLKDHNCFTFFGYPYRKFEVNFFPDPSAIKEKLNKEKLDEISSIEEMPIQESKCLII